MIKIFYYKVILNTKEENMEDIEDMFKNDEDQPEDTSKRANRKNKVMRTKKKEEENKEDHNH